MYLGMLPRKLDTSNNEANQEGGILDVYEGLLGIAKGGGEIQTYRDQ